MQILLVYTGASFATLEALDLLIGHLGLPHWVFPGAVMLLLFGFPIIVTTALVQAAPGPKPGEATPGTEAARPELERSVTATDVAAVAKHWLTWRKSILGGVLAFALLGVSAAAYIAARELGVGPVSSLVAAGALDPREPIVLADFTNLTDESLLGVVVTEALRSELAESRLVRVAERDWAARALARSGKGPDLPLGLGLARELALQEGLETVIAGEIRAVGAAYLLSVKIIAAESGELLAVFREAAEDSEAIIEAIDRLSSRFR